MLLGANTGRCCVRQNAMKIKACPFDSTHREERRKGVNIKKGNFPSLFSMLDRPNQLSGSYDSARISLLQLALRTM